MQKNRHQLALTGFLAIFISALVITAAAAFAGWQIKKDGFRITARFNFLGNLMEGAPVLIAGCIQVGKVEEIYQENLHTRLTLYLDSSLEGKIPNNSNTRVSVFTNNLLGEKYISLVPGEVQPGDRFLQEGDEIRGIDPPSVDQMML
ncbi:MAG: MCE family protein, partial [Leptospiraceae bacterium]|nr:MCE family protein [Leptospiraceae bacterium]